MMDASGYYLTFDPDTTVDNFINWIKESCSDKSGIIRFMGINVGIDDFSYNYTDGVIDESFYRIYKDIIGSFSVNSIDAIQYYRNMHLNFTVIYINKGENK